MGRTRREDPATAKEGKTFQGDVIKDCRERNFQRQGPPCPERPRMNRTKDQRAAGKRKKEDANCRKGFR